jgi:hypothetical protein
MDENPSLLQVWQCKSSASEMDQGWCEVAQTSKLAAWKMNEPYIYVLLFSLPSLF